MTCLWTMWMCVSYQLENNITHKNSSARSALPTGFCRRGVPARGGGELLFGSSSAGAPAIGRAPGVDGACSSAKEHLRFPRAFGDGERTAQIGRIAFM